MKKLILSALSLFALTAMANDQVTDPRSKENSKFEAQGTSELDLLAIPRIVAEFAEKYQVLNDGSVAATFNTVIPTGPDSASQKNVDISVETRVFSKCASEREDRRRDLERDLKSGYFDREELNKRLAKLETEACKDLVYEPMSDGLFLPIEFRVRVPVSGEMGEAELKDLRIGIGRMLWSTGFNLQVFSLILKNYDLGQGGFAGIEVLDLSLNRAFTLKGLKSVELIIKGSAGLSGGRLRLNRSLVSSTAQAIEGKEEGETFVSPAGSLRGATGIRIKKKVLVELFGGIEAIAGGGSASDTYAKVSNGLTSADLTYSYRGVGLRAMPTSWLNVIVTARQDRYRSNVELLNEERAPELPQTSAGSSDQRATYVGAAVEFRY